MLMRGAGRGLPLRRSGTAVGGVQSDRARRMAALTAPQSSRNGWVGGGFGGGCSGGLLACASPVAGMVAVGDVTESETRAYHTQSHGI